MGLLHRGFRDPNTESASQLSAARDALIGLVKTTNLKFDTNEYQHLADGSLWLHQAWSGDMAAAPLYTPKGTPASVLRYWWPKDGRGPINNDMFGVLRGARNPVLAHLFLNHLLDNDEALKNFSFNYYQQPLNSMTPELLVSHKLIPPTLDSTIIREPQFKQGLVQGPLSQYGAVLWENAWAAVSVGMSGTAELARLRAPRGALARPVHGHPRVRGAGDGVRQGEFPAAAAAGVEPRDLERRLPLQGGLGGAARRRVLAVGAQHPRLRRGVARALLRDRLPGRLLRGAPCRADEGAPDHPARDPVLGQLPAADARLDRAARLRRLRQQDPDRTSGSRTRPTG